MGKDLRTTPAELRLHRHGTLDGTLWDMKIMQPFFPSLEALFKTDTVSNLSEYGVRLSEEIQSVVGPSRIQIKGKQIDIHRKSTMLLSPFKWMRGDYGVLGLPKPEDIAADIQNKLQSRNSAGYVGALASIALSESGCDHFPKVYGVYVGLSANHVLDISDDYEDLSERKWFGDNVGKTFELKLRIPEPVAEFKHTRGRRPEVMLGEDILLGDIEDMSASHVSTPSSRSLSKSDVADSDSEYREDRSHTDSDDEFEIRSCDCSDDSDDEEDRGLDDEGDDEPFAWATFKDVPVITTVMEVCTGTFYDLIRDHPEPAKHAAWVAQIVFALAYAQRTLGFVHNDLHGNNVMYVPTEHEFLYYNQGGKCYQIPTYGYLIKIIDFDRASFSLRLAGMKEPRHFISSQFQPKEEAAGQYNVEPFFSQDHPRIPPNPSFDLCRFATSMFWDMFPKGPDDSNPHPLFGVFKQWMTQSDGTSVFFREQMDRHDRYHGFDLYKAIARYCKDSATPRREIAKLSGFLVPSIPVGSKCLFIES